VILSYTSVVGLSASMFFFIKFKLLLGGKKKPLKAPKKDNKELDDV
jgi:hypothetical protein